MKSIIIAFFLIFSVICGCKKEEDTSFSDGIITGVDYRKCMCCSGYFIKIDTLKYRFFAIPDTTEINLEKAVFPIPVKLKWKKMESNCSDVIEVIEMKTR